MNARFIEEAQDKAIAKDYRVAIGHETETCIACSQCETEERAGTMRIEVEFQSLRFQRA